MKVNLFHKDYAKMKNLYDDFINGKTATSPIYSSFDEVEIAENKPFEIYFGKNITNGKEKFLESILVVKDYYEQLDREYLYDQRFWNSLFLKYNVEYFLNIYPELKEDSDLFYKTIFLRKFDWGNYVYKLVIAVDFIESNIDFEPQKETYYEMIFDNLDVFNYIIKYSIFRSGDFLIKILKIIQENDISKELKSKLKHLPGDQRLGRMIIFELNKVYPVIMSPLMSYEELEDRFMTIYHEFIKTEERYLSIRLSMSE